MNSPNVVMPSGEFATWQVLEKEMHSDRDTVNINFLCRKKLDITFVIQKTENRKTDRTVGGLNCCISNISSGTA